MCRLLICEMHVFKSMPIRRYGRSKQLFSGPSASVLHVWDLAECGATYYDVCYKIGGGVW